MRRAVIAMAALAACASGTVTQFPPLSLYNGNGGYSASNTDNLGSTAINGDITVKNYAIGAGLAPAPFGACPVFRGFL